MGAARRPRHLLAAGRPVTSVIRTAQRPPVDDELAGAEAAAVDEQLDRIVDEAVERDRGAGVEARVAWISESRVAAELGAELDRHLAHRLRRDRVEARRRRTARASAPRRGRRRRCVMRIRRAFGIRCDEPDRLAGDGVGDRGRARREIEPGERLGRRCRRRASSAGASSSASPSSAAVRRGGRVEQPRGRLADRRELRRRDRALRRPSPDRRRCASRPSLRAARAAHHDHVAAGRAVRRRRRS